MSPAATICDKCGVDIGSPHTYDDDDCILDHPDHTARYVGLICRRHYHWIDSTLDQILELFALTQDTIEPGSGSDGRPSGAVFAPAPLRLGVAALTDPRAKTPIDLDEDDIPDLPGTLSSWAQKTWDERASEHDPPLDGTVSGSVMFLHRERHWIAQQPDIDDYALELDFLHRAVARAVGDSMWPRPIGYCPNCPARTKLFNTIGVDEVTCRKCKTTWAGTALARLRLIHEQEAG